VEGREMTSFKSVKTDLVKAGAISADREVAVSNGIITSRNPGNLGAFSAKIVEGVEVGGHARSAD
jgi:protease I